MSPPNLPTDTPILDIIHPFVIRFFPLLWNDFCLPGIDCLDRLSSERLDRDIPLLTHIGFNGRPTTVAFANSIGIIINFIQQTQCFKVGDNFCPGNIPFHADIGTTLFIYLPGLIKNIDKFQVVPLANFKIIKIVCRSNLYRTTTKILVNVFISNNRDFTIHQW